ncbi:MAG TPA: sulfotransferase [Fimbriimonadaceae bacterium]
MFAEAQAAVKGKRYPEALAAAKELESLQPNSARAKVLLANLAFLSGDVASAESYLRQAVSLEPGHLEATIGLASLLANGANPSEAIQLCDSAIALNPNLGSAYFHKGRALVAECRAQDALASLEVASKLMPQSAAAHHWMGVATQMAGNTPKAASLFREVIAIDKTFAASYGALGNLLLSVGDRAGGIANLKFAAELAPQSVEGQLWLAKALAEENLLKDAQQVLDNLLDKAPDLVEGLVLLGRVCIQLGEFERAAEILIKAGELDPNRIDIFTMLVAAPISNLGPELIKRMQGISASARLSVDEAIPLHYSLGKALEDLGDNERAFAEYREGNALAQRKLEAQGKGFDRTARKLAVDAAIKGFTASQLGRWRENGSQDDSPIFIVGMPRSGTTLLEQVISSHPEVGAASELGTWKTLATQDHLNGQRTPSANEAKAIASEFLQRLQAAAPGKRRVTEKTPQNYLILGPILGLLPNARIIHCKRNPLDTCVSIYTTLFMNGPEYGHDLEDLKDVYRQYERLMSHWRSILPKDRFMEVQYEDFVNDREPILREILKFLNLEWNESCLAHESNNHPISTPNVWQARQPVNSNSIGRWKKFESWLGPLLDLKH